MFGHKGPIQRNAIISSISEKGAAIEFLDGKKPFDGWKTILNEKDAWIQFDAVDFGNKAVKSVKIKAMSAAESALALRVGKEDASVEAKADIPKSADWQVVIADVRGAPSGIQDIKLLLKDAGRVEIDWIQFE